MIDTDVRNVKRAEVGYSALKKPELKVESLCLRCAINDNCPSYRMTNESRDTVFKITECGHYVWPLVFRDSKGTEKAFNTFRMGKAWSERLKTGDRVGLIDKDNNLYGTAIVLQSILLSKEEALKLHGQSNHLMLTESRKETPEKLAKVLRNSYGGLVYSNNDQISVIYLEREV